MRRRLATWVITAGVLLAPALAAPGASARIIEATSSLPPGESGYVSIAGLASGTGSPHLYDQQQPFIAFDRKDAMLGQSAATVEHPAAGVTIDRDSFGVPSVTGDTAGELWWGAGYATAEDRLAELEIFRRAANGTLAAVLGPSYLSMDIEVRRDFYTTAELTHLVAQLPADMQQRYESYAAGINAYVDYVRSHPSEIPGEFPALGILPTHFSVEDLAAIGVYLARTTPNGDGDDLNNMRALLESGPAKFNRILPLRIPGQISTIPARDGRFPSVPGRTRAQERTALRRSYAYLRGIPVPAASSDGTELVSGSIPAGGRAAAGRGAAARLIHPIHVGGSYMIAVSDPRHHRALMFNGPELGFSAPEELYELELHGPGLDARGITAPGAPVIAIGHNAHVAWGLTSGLSQTNALYVERLVPGHPDEYYYRGRVTAMACRDETFQYRSPPTGLLNPAGLLQSPPTVGSVTLRLCRTNEGPVQARAGGYAFSRRYATWMREIDTITGLAEVDTSRTIAQVGRAVSTLTWNENLMAADDRGNIGYWHPGLLPIRPAGWDERLPYPGDGRAQWRGFLPVRERPHVIDPQQRYLANWNTLPSQGWTTGNDPASERLGGPFFRGAYLNRLTAPLVKHPTFPGLDRTIYLAATVAQQRPLDTARLRAALRGAAARSSAAIVLRTLLAWNGSYAQEDSAGTVAPGVAAWQEFKDRLQAIALAPLGAAGQLIGGGEPNSEHLFDASLGQAYALRVLDAAGYRRAAAQTYSALVKRFASGDPSRWREPRTMAPESSLGAEQPPPMPFFDRGTFEELTELGP
jgi:acyl-homoserine lactone acylase PvdQ